MTVTVVVGTYGEESWSTLAQERAVPSAGAQDVPVVHVHGESLHEARNAALALVETDHVVFLDADDELEAGYVDCLAAGSADIRVPSVRYVLATGAAQRPRVPRVWGHRHDCTGDCLPQGNYIVIGAMAPTNLLRELGGFRNFSWSEDWDLWLRCYLAGATFETLPEAVYRAHVRPDSRNRAPEQAFKLAAHQAIYNANFPQAA